MNATNKKNYFNFWKKTNQRASLVIYMFHASWEE